MKNKAMERKFKNHGAIDVRKAATHIEDDDGATLYTLPEYVDNIDYADGESEQWIWSIGRSLETGKIIAATDTRFYKNPYFECLWLR